MTEGVFNCLIDEDRTNFFKKAIINTVKSGDVVVDMGTGSGVLAMLAAEAGASKVYAIEIDENNTKILEKVFDLNGHGDKIKLIRGDVTEIAIPEPVDVIIGEMIATGLIEELQIPAMNNVLKYAKPNVRVVLSKYENYLDLVYNNNEYYGHKFQIMRYEYPDLDKLKSEPFSDRSLYSSVDFSVVNNDNFIEKELELLITKNGNINGLRISSKTIFYDESEMWASFAYSYPIVLPIDEQNVSVGDKFLCKISYELCGGFKDFSYSVLKI